MYPSRMLLAVVFSGNKDSYCHRFSVVGNVLSNNLYPLRL